MNENDILHAMGDVDGRFIAESAPKRKKSRKPLFFGGGLTAAACVGLAAAIALGGTGNRPVSGVLFAAEYPASLKYVEYPYSDGIDAERQKEQLGHEHKEVLDGFVRNSAAQILSDDSGKNMVCSPLNLFEALSILAETTDGETKAQIMNLLGTDNDTLRPAAQGLMKANIVDDTVSTSILANSVWLGEGLSYNAETLKLLAEDYYASSFSGRFGTKEYDKALQGWLNEQTRGLLEQQAGNISLPEEALFCLASTTYFSARWQYEFSPSKNTFDTFHTPNGDVTAEFMHKNSDHHIFWGERFQAYDLYFASECGGKMRLILPDEGVEVNELLSDPELYDFLSSSDWKNSAYKQVNLSLPKFDVNSELELSDSLKALGVTDAFSENADFSPMLDGTAFLSEVRHAARVTVDEEGTQAAAFTVEMPCGAGPAPDTIAVMTFDRPFIFVVESHCGSTLFMGVVNNPLG